MRAWKRWVYGESREKCEDAWWLLRYEGGGVPLSTSQSTINKNISWKDACNSGHLANNQASPLNNNLPTVPVELGGYSANGKQFIVNPLGESNCDDDEVGYNNLRSRVPQK